MCFCKTRQSKVLRAKRDIVVYKIGVKANKAIFTPYFMTKFSYIAGIKNTTDPNFNISHRFQSMNYAIMVIKLDK